MSGVYFLFQDGKMVYIGQSRNVERRISTHNIDHDSYRVIPCAIADLLRYERRLINYFKPPLNGVVGGPREGAGRKIGSYQNGEKKEATVPMRIPIRMLPIVDEYIRRYHESKKLGAPLEVADLYLMAEELGATPYEAS